MKNWMLLLVVVVAIFTGCASGKTDGFADNENQGVIITADTTQKLTKKVSLAPSSVCSTDTAKGEKQPVIRAY